MDRALREFLAGVPELVVVAMDTTIRLLRGLGRLPRRSTSSRVSLAHQRAEQREEARQSEALASEGKTVSVRAAVTVGSFHEEVEGYSTTQVLVLPPTFQAFEELATRLERRGFALKLVRYKGRMACIIVRKDQIDVALGEFGRLVEDDELGSID